MRLGPLSYQSAYDVLSAKGYKPVPGSSRFEDGAGHTGRITEAPGRGDTWYAETDEGEGPAGIGTPCPACGTALEDFGAHGAACPRCAAAEDASLTVNGTSPRFAEGFADGRRDREHGLTRQLCTTSTGARPPVVKRHDADYYHGYKAAAEGATSEPSAYITYRAKHRGRVEMAANARERTPEFFAREAVMDWAEERPVGERSLRGTHGKVEVVNIRAPRPEVLASGKSWVEVAEQLGLAVTPNPAHLTLDGTFSFGVGSEDDKHMRSNSGYVDCACRDCFDAAISSNGPALCNECEEAGCDVEGESECQREDAYQGDYEENAISRGRLQVPSETLIDMGDSIVSHSPGTMSLSDTVLSLGVPRRKRRVYAIRMGIDDRGIATGGLHWVPASNPLKAESEWLRLTGRQVQLASDHHEPNARLAMEQRRQHALRLWELELDEPLRRYLVMDACNGTALESHDDLDDALRAMREHWDESHMPVEVRDRNGDGGIVNEIGPARACATGHEPNMARPKVQVTIQDDAGTLLHSETRSAFNAGVKASEAAIRKIALSEHTVYEGAKPVSNIRTAADNEEAVYTRRWVSRGGRSLTATITKESDESVRRREFGPDWRRPIVGDAAEHEPNARKNVTAVIDAFRDGRPKREATCSTDGYTLYSYGLPIASRNRGEVEVLDLSESPSRTTSSQIRAVMAAFPGARTVSSVMHESAYGVTARHEPNRRGGSVIESRRWRHRSGRTASPYGAVPWTGAPGDRESDWQMESAGWTIQWDDGTVGIGRVPFETRDQAEAWLAKEHARLQEAEEWRLRAFPEQAQPAPRRRRSRSHSSNASDGTDAHDPNWRMMLDLPGIERRLGAERVAAVLTDITPQAVARGLAADAWEVDNAPEYEAYTSLARMIDDGELDDLIAEARGAGR